MTLNLERGALILAVNWFRQLESDKERAEAIERDREGDT